MKGSHNSDTVIAFYNDRVKEVIAADIIAEPFTFVPPLAGHMELVGGNAIVFGKITEGFDAISINVTTEINYINVFAEHPVGALTVSYSYSEMIIEYWNTPAIGEFGGPYKTTKELWDGTLSFNLPQGIVIIEIPTIVKAGTIFYITILNATEGINVSASYTVQAGDTHVQVKAELEADLLAKGVAAADIEVGPFNAKIALYGGRTAYFNRTPTPEAIDMNKVYKDFTFSAFILDIGQTLKYPQLKIGATHEFGFVYKDGAGRTCSVLRSDDLTKYIPFYSEGDGSELWEIVNVKFRITHKPPDWAETYEIVYFGNVSMDYFLQVRANNITLIPNSNGNRFSVNIQDTLDHARNQNNRWKVADYVWEDGDRMRLLGTINDSTGYGEAIGGGFNYDYEIEATGTQYNESAIGAGGDWLIVQAVERPEPFAGETNILVEVYRPMKGLSQVSAYGTGMVFDIGTDANGHKYHKGDVDQVFDASGVCTTPGEVNTVEFDENNMPISRAYDSWKFNRINYEQIGDVQTSAIQPFWAESIFPSDWWNQQDINRKLTSQGFPFLNDISQRKAVLDERFRYGGTLIEGTRTNNIAHFTFANFRDLQKKNGDITGLREVGYTLKVIQMYKETSVYINRVQTFSADGRSQFTLTDSFIGDIRPMEDDWGCQHPDSIMVNGRNVYYWDNSQGVFIRSAPNGQVVLDIKMKRYFKDIVKWIQLNGGHSLLETRTGANNEHDEIWLTFRMGTEVRGVIFSEKQGRFISRINQITETYFHLGNFFGHLYHQRVWIMNIDEGQDYLSWSGTPVYAEIEVVSNIEPVKNKVYNAVALYADHQMQSLPKYVYIPEEASGASELMESNIPVWERREGVFFGAILKDENSKGNFVSLYDKKMNGRAMRGRHCYVRFRTEEHDEKVRIDAVVIMSTPSERNV